MPQTGPDLPSAGYPISKPLLALMGGLSNISSPNVPVKTNLDWNGLTAWSDRSGGASGGQTVLSVAVPVLPGDVISKVTYLVGATGMASPTHSWAALYSGTGSAPGTVGVSPVLIAQTPDVTATANVIASAKQFTFTFGTPVTVQQSQAPYGFVYVSCAFANTAANGPSYIGSTIASPTYQWFTNGPVFLVGTHDSASTAGSAAPATMGTVTAGANPPIVILT